MFFTRPIIVSGTVYLVQFYSSPLFDSAFKRSYAWPGCGQVSESGKCGRAMEMQIGDGPCDTFVQYRARRKGTM